MRYLIDTCKDSLDSVGRLQVIGSLVVVILATVAVGPASVIFGKVPYGNFVRAFVSFIDIAAAIAFVMWVLILTPARKIATLEAQLGQTTPNPTIVANTVVMEQHNYYLAGDPEVRLHRGPELPPQHGPGQQPGLPPGRQQ